VALLKWNELFKADDNSGYCSRPVLHQRTALHVFLDLFEILSHAGAGLASVAVLRKVEVVQTEEKAAKEVQEAETAAKEV